jgi:uncharacterized NAD(P)/FAD-binding protein YdhS
VICGGGASALLLLAALRNRSEPIHATVVEPRTDLGVGTAYSTTCPAHLLNTRACNMSLSEERDDFVRWLRVRRPRRVINWTGNDFAPRSYFGEYLREHLHALRGAPNLRLTHVASSADALLPADEGWEVVLSHGASLAADIVVLATGNALPRPIGSSLSAQANGLFIDDPWNQAQKAAIPPTAAVLLVGTGLTAVDMVVELLEHGHTGPIYACSRRGLLPRPHGPVAMVPEDFRPTLPASLRGLVAHVRALCAHDPDGGKWRAAFTELRAAAPALWQAWTPKERRRFLRHVRPFWTVHRHRLAPRVHAKISRALASGQLRVLRGRIGGIEHQSPDDLLSVTLQQPHGTRALRVARVVNCTGPDENPLSSRNPLLTALVTDSIARIDALKLGLAVDGGLRVVSGDGLAHQSLYALGSLTRGTLWETTAIPELREQATRIARQIERQLAGARVARLPTIQSTAA